MTVIYLCRVHLQADIDRESIVQIPKVRRPTGFIRKSALPLDEDDDEDDDVDDDEDDDEEMVVNKKLGNRRATGFIRKQYVPEDNEDEENEEINEGLVEGEAVEEEVVEEEVVQKKKIYNRRATGYIRKQYVPLDEDVEEEANKVDQEIKSPIKTPVNGRRVTPNARGAPVDDDIGKEKSDESIDLKPSTKKKAAGFAADEHLETIRVMSKQGVNKTDSDEERQ